jgi:hypothetical protein
MAYFKKLNSFSQLFSLCLRYKQIIEIIKMTWSIQRRYKKTYNEISIRTWKKPKSLYKKHTIRLAMTWKVIMLLLDISKKFDSLNINIWRLLVDRDFKNHAIELWPSRLSFLVTYLSILKRSVYMTTTKDNPLSLDEVQ